MLSSMFGWSFLVVFTACLGGQVPPGAQWQRADRATARLSPSAFRDLPASIHNELLRRGCTIPQAAFWRPEPHNVIRGAFTAAGQEDIAVLCSRNRVSSILVFRGGSIESVAELARKPDSAFLQVAGAQQEIAFSRTIGVADADYIRRHYEWYGGPKPPPLDHAGINDAFTEKASVVWYWYRGRWLRLTGAD